MHTVLEILKLSADYLKQKGIVHPRRQAEEILCDFLGFSRLELYTHSDKPLTEDELAKCRDALVRRGKGEPLQYIRGEVEFLNCRFQVNSSVLIPRQETEILVDKIIKILSKEEDLTNKTLWDICCGSGCIGISIKKQFPSLNVVLSDISPEAIEVAKKNAKLNAVDLSVLQGDLFEPFDKKKAHFIVCNPPYVAEEELDQLDIEVRQYEPHLALAAGKTGLEFYRRIADEIKTYLFPHGKVWLEIGASQGSEIKKMFNAPVWIQRIVEQDWAGHDRFFFLEIE